MMARKAFNARENIVVKEEVVEDLAFDNAVDVEEAAEAAELKIDAMTLGNFPIQKNKPVLLPQIPQQKKIIPYVKR